MATKNPLTRPKALGRMLNFAAGASTTMCQDLLSEHGLTLAQWVILSALWRQDGMLVSEIADYSGNNAPAASRIVDRMEEGGLVKRVPSKEDKRVVLVCLTKQGQSLDHLANFYETVNQRLLEGLSDEEAELLFGLLERVEANARARPEA
ncbi:MarR family transcriptional regulator [uncultured Hoeflea sp.]|uniref:MarR family winged helix-turn-helix transcriptional regulator n=1 Tax=uncultured Hoeflea sp. TaxID=538666 RepID=UPI002619CBF0|nr:MarR family transcriptional regulator [uncultured Hoeflea sp.]